MLLNLQLFMCFKFSPQAYFFYGGILELTFIKSSLLNVLKDHYVVTVSGCLQKV